MNKFKKIYENYILIYEIFVIQKNYIELLLIIYEKNWKLKIVKEVYKMRI